MKISSRNPSDFLSVLPLSYPLDVILRYELATSVLLPVTPHAVVDATVFPSEFPLPLTLVIDEVALVLFAILPGQYSVAMHLVLFPLTLVGLSIRPHIAALA